MIGRTEKLGVSQTVVEQRRDDALAGLDVGAHEHLGHRE
jgi:hypothetical protein